MATSIISPVYKSIVRHVSDMIDGFNQAGTYGVIGYHNWESRGDENKLPQNTLIGVEGFGFTENHGLWVVRFGLGVSSFRDINLLDEIDLIDAIQQNMGEGEKVSLLSMVDATVVNEMVVSTFQVLPMAQSEIRNYRTIGIELLRTGT